MPSRLARSCVSGLLLAIAMASPVIAEETNDEFTQLVEQIQVDASAATEADVIRMLAMATEQQRSIEASVAVDAYLASNFSPSPDLLLAAAQNAEAAGSPREAVERYGQYLSRATPNATSSAIAADYLHLLIDKLGEDNNAYNFVSRSALRFRDDPAARRYDTWFLGQAIERGDMTTVANALKAMTDGADSVEQVTLYYRPAFERLLSGVNSIDDPEILALMAEVAGRIAQDDASRARYDFRISAVQQGLAGGEAGLDGVMRKAQAWLSADPRGDVLNRIAIELGTQRQGDRRGRWHNDTWKARAGDKRAMIVRGYQSLDEAQQLRFLRTRIDNEPSFRRLGNPRLLFAAGARDPRIFAQWGRVRFGDIFPEDQAQIQAMINEMAPRLPEGSGGMFGAIVRSLKAGDDLAAVANQFFGSESWQLSSRDAFWTFRDTVQPAYEWLRGGADKAARDAAITSQSWMAAVGDPWASRSPALSYDRDAIRTYLGVAFAADKAGFPERVEALRWIPFNREARDRGLNEWINRDFSRWRSTIQKQASNERDRNHQQAREMAPLIAPINAALERLRDPNGVQPNQAPTPALQAWSQAELAIRAEDWATAAEALQSLTGPARSGRGDQLPFARDLIGGLVGNGRVTGPAYQAQVDLLGAATSAWPAGAWGYEGGLVDRFIGSRRDWPDRTRTNERERVLALNAVILAGLQRHIQGGDVHPGLFDRFLRTRRGRDWRDVNSGQDEMAQMLERGLAVDTGVRWSGYRSTVTSLMTTVRNDFPGLAERFPVESWFDDAFIAEAKANAFFDPKYWDFGRDNEGKVRAAAAQALGGANLPPLRGTGASPSYSGDDLQAWLGRALAGDSRKSARDAVAAGWSQRQDGWGAGRAYFRQVRNFGSGEADIATYRANLNTYIDRLTTLPTRGSGVELYAYAELNEYAAEDVQVLVRLFTELRPAGWPGRAGVETTIRRLVQTLIKNGDDANLLAVAPEAWRIAERANDRGLAAFMLDRVKGFMAEENDEIVGSLAGTGLDIVRRSLDEAQRRDLEAAANKARSAVGPVLSVNENDPRYPAFAAQRNWQIGRTRGAWDFYAQPGTDELVRTLVGELNLDFVIWVVNEHTRREQYDEGDLLCRSVLSWMDELDIPIPSDKRADVLLARAKIAMARRSYPVARAQFRYIAEGEEFLGSRQATVAELLTAEVDRLTNRSDEALRLLNQLARSKDTFTRAQALFYTAKVQADQEQYEEARDLLEQAMEIESDLEMVFFQKQLQLQLRDLLSARSWLVDSEGRDKIVPDRPLEISVQDRNSVMSKNFSSITLRVWTETTGDEEFLTLSQADDAGELFMGDLPTEMGPAVPGDGRIQIVGGDKIHYDLSEEFIAKTNYERTQPTEVVLRVVSDADLFATSGKILTEEEIQRQRMEEIYARTTGFNIGGDDEDNVPLSERRPGNQVRPGNPINVRVTDLDRNLTDSPDSIIVRVESSSGDSIGSFELLETGGHSGVFQGSVPTDRLPARAYASDSAAGNDPNVVISPSEDLPAWSGASGEQGLRYFGVDFNDLVELGNLTVVGGLPENRTTRMVVQTSLNDRDFQTVGAWPDQISPWDGSLEGIAVPVAAGTTLAEHGQLSSYLDVMASDPRFKAHRFTPSGEAFGISWSDLEGAWGDFPENLPTVPASSSDTRVRGAVASQPSVLVRVRGVFFVDQRQSVSFFKMRSALAEEAIAAAAGEGRNRRAPAGASLRLFVNGQELEEPIALRGEEPSGPPELTVELGKGLHEIELIALVPRSVGASVDSIVKTKVPEPPYVVPVDNSFFDLTGQRELLADWQISPTAIAYDQASNNHTVDMRGQAGRVVRLWMLDYEGGAPSIRKIQLGDEEGERVLPMDRDFDELRRNQILEVGPGDRISLSYTDPTPFSSQNDQHEAYLSANFYNASLTPAFSQYRESGSTVTESYAPLRRFEIGDTVRVRIQDYDADVSSEIDVLRYRVTTSAGVELELEAPETEPHSGVFVGTVFPVSGAPQRDSELTIAAGDDVVVTYRDNENTDPGIPWDRSELIEQVVWTEPEMRVMSSHTEELPEDERLARLAQLEARAALDAEENRGERAAPVEAPRYRLIVERPDEPVPNGRFPDEPAMLTLGTGLSVEVIWPTVAKSSASRVQIYAQTAAGRRAAGLADDDPTFDTSVPGTIELSAGPAFSATGGGLPAGYADSVLIGERPVGEAIDVGSFAVTIPVQLGDTPSESLVGKPDLTNDQLKLLVTAEDEIVVGFRYEDRNGVEQWQTQRVVLGGASLFNVYDRDFAEVLTDFYVGETAYFRITDPLANTSGEKDRVILQATTASGHTRTIELVETLSHSGVFQSLAPFAHEEDTQATTELNAVPVAYGDTVTFSYTNGEYTTERQVQIERGADGEVVPFTKRFRDPDIAMSTMFSIAEAYFELAKQHRALADEAEQKGDERNADRLGRLVRESIASGRRTLEEAIRDFPETELRAQADYLLAELDLEFANEAVNEDDQRSFYESALQRFSSIIANYPDSEYAPKAQYKRALVYEEMGEMDVASAEYVKLSFRFPDHELVADALVRLGAYFQGKGTELFKAAEEILESDPVRSNALKQEANEFFITGGNVFSKLRDRFPENELAAQATVAAGVCYKWGGDLENAILQLETVTTDVELDAPMVKAEALYWLGDAYLAMVESRNVPRGVDARGRAGLALQRCSIDFPDTIWAKRARGLLAQMNSRR